MHKLVAVVMIFALFMTGTVHYASSAYASDVSDDSQSEAGSGEEDSSDDGGGDDGED